MRVVFDGIGHNQVVGDLMEHSEGRMAMPSHWVYMINRNRAGNVLPFMARLVCGGNHQIEGIDNQAM